MNEQNNTSSKKTVLITIAFVLALLMVVGVALIVTQLSMLNTTRIVELATSNDCNCLCHKGCCDCCACDCNDENYNIATSGQAYWDEDALSSQTPVKEKAVASAAYIRQSSEDVDYEDTLSTPSTPNRGTINNSEPGSSDGDDDPADTEPTNPGPGAGNTTESPADDDRPETENPPANGSEQDPVDPPESTDPSAPPADEEVNEDTKHFVISGDQPAAEQPPVSLIF